MARPRKFDEQQVLRTARDEFWATGYAGTSIDAVATVTGLGKGSLYGAFGDKHKLFIRVFDDYCADVTEATVRALSGPDTEAFARLQAHVRAVAAGGGTDSAHRGCFLAKGTAELSEHDPEVAARARQAFTALEQALTANIEAAQLNGDVDPAADARAQARLILAVLRGIEALGKADVDADSLRSIAETALAALPRP